MSAGDPLGTNSNRARRIGPRLLAFIAVVLVLSALKLSASVMLPLVFALFLIAVFWPLQRYLAGRMPQGAALLLTLLTFLIVVGLFAGALWFSGQLVASRASSYEQQFRQLYEQAQGWAAQRGLSVPGGSGGGPGGASGLLGDVLTRLSERVLAFAGGFVLVLAFFVLGLLEVPDFRAKLERGLRGTHGTRWLGPLHDIAVDFQRYIVVRTVVGLITGIAVGVFCWIIGLDFAFIWGLTNFLLNYIPTLGSIVAVFPPFLFALVQFDGVAMPLFVLLGVGGVQLLMGNYIDPLLQGRYLSLSPIVVLFSVAFWGWLWGIAGAFIGIPITVALVIACNQFDRTRWLAVLLADVQGGEPTYREDGAEPAPAAQERGSG